MSQTLTPFRVQKYLAGLRYPASRQQVVSRALERGADEQLIGVLRRIPDRWYPSPVALSQQVGRPMAGEAAPLRDEVPAS
jgi:hypothetical protein